MTERAAPATWRLVAAFLAVYLIWGSTYLAIAFAIETLPPFLMSGVRMLIAGLTLYAGTRLAGVPRPAPAHWRPAAVLGVLFFLCGYGAVAWVEQRVPSGLTAVLVAVMPLWAVLIDWLRPGGVRPPASLLLGVLVGLVGVAVLVLPTGGLGGAGQVDPLGALVLMCSSFLWAVGSLHARQASAPGNTMQFAGMQMLLGGVMLLGLSALAGDWRGFALSAVSLKSWMALLYLVTFGSIVVFTVFSWLLRVADTAKVATYAYVNPIIAVALGWALGGEALTVRSAVAAGIVVGAVGLIITARSAVRTIRGRLPRLSRVGVGMTNPSVAANLDR